MRDIVGATLHKIIIIIIMRMDDVRLDDSRSTEHLLTISASLR
jgi:hypothetical protein